MSQNQLPDIKKLNARLARNNAWVVSFIEGLMGNVDKLLEATQAEDWEEVRRQTAYLADSSQAYGFPDVAESAMQVYEALDNGADTVEVKRHLIRLVSQCGTIRMPDRSKGASRNQEAT